MLKCEYQDIIVCLVGAVACEVNLTNMTAESEDKTRSKNSKMSHNIRATSATFKNVTDTVEVNSLLLMISKAAARD